MPKTKTNKANKTNKEIIKFVEYIPQYPYTYIQSIEQSVKHIPSKSNIYRHESELALLEALKAGRARAI